MRQLTEEELELMDRTERRCFVCEAAQAFYDEVAEVDLCIYHMLEFRSRQEV